MFVALKWCGLDAGQAGGQGRDLSGIDAEIADKGAVAACDDHNFMVADG